MNAKIIEALLKLDVGNDNQWTQDGLPKLESLKFHIGESVTREQVNEAAPGFTRSNPVVGESKDATSTEPTQTEQIQDPIEPVQQTQAEGAGATEESAQAPQTSEAVNVVTDRVAKEPINVAMTVAVNVGISDIVKAALTELDFVKVTELSDEELSELKAKHASITSADNVFQAELNEYVRKRALYLASVDQEHSKRFPGMTQAQQLEAFHNRVIANANKYPINQPRPTMRGRK